MNYTELVENQRRYFMTQATKPVSFRIEQLKRLRQSIENHRDKIFHALWLDLHKCREEAFMTEYNIVMSEIKAHLKYIRRWVRDECVRTPVYLKPSRSYVINEPYGVALVIAPWNYPLNLMFTPLVGAISSGCCAVLKPSPYSMNTSAVMQEIIDECFEPQYIAMVQGHRDVNMRLLEQHFDVIFYTGSPDVGRVVMSAAAKNLTPLTLELGGKSPCIVDSGCNIEFAARRIVWGKTINAGQTCVAPDYLFVNEKVKDELVEKMRACVRRFYGDDMRKSDKYCRMINENAFKRVSSYINDGHVVIGGSTDAAERYIEFTVIDNVKTDSEVLEKEIFGPVLPMMSFKNISEVIGFVSARPKPLAFYYFGDNENAKNILGSTSSGGACINDTILHVANENLPFGGVNNSGIGKYHSKDSFLAFSNRKSVLKSSNRIDFMMKYPPYDKFDTISRLM
ncbi:MAG: aldehyde dehydrogenase [Candidatus Limimorpha sp.]